MKMNLETLVNTLREMVLQGVEITTHKIQKGNITLTGISIGHEELRPTVYVEDYEECFRKGGYELVAREMLKTASKAELPKVDATQISTWDYAKDSLMLCIAPKGTNKGFVTYPYLDLELYVRVNVMENGTYKVTEPLLDFWKISRETLLQTAVSNSKYTINHIEEILFENTKDIAPEDFHYDNNNHSMYVISNHEGLYGSGVMYCKEVLKIIANKMNADLIITPSSIHEIIIHPMEDNVSITEVNAMIREVNATQVLPEEVLSNHAYIFHRDTMEITY